MAALCRSCMTLRLTSTRSYITRSSLSRLTSPDKAPARYTAPREIPIHAALPGPPEKNPMPSLTQRLMDRYDVSGEKAALVRRDNPDRIRPGHVVSVFTYTNYPSKAGVSVFSGYVIGIRRAGLETCLMLRNQLVKTGVELRIPLFSPTVREVRIIKRDPPSRRRIRRAKLFYFRKPEHDRGSVAGFVKADEAARQRKK
ncbi:hypothetical protein PYCC9005_002975 [Savitreella phatthalungensis]